MESVGLGHYMDGIESFAKYFYKITEFFVRAALWTHHTNLNRTYSTLLPKQVLKSKSYLDNRQSQSLQHKYIFLQVIVIPVTYYYSLFCYKYEEENLRC